MAIVYLVMERTFFYTDEVYIPLEDGICNNPQKIFFDKSAAQSYADILNVRQFAGMQPDQFASAPEEIITSRSTAEFFQKLKAILGDELEEGIEWWNLCIPNNLSDAQLTEVAGLFNFVRYIVVEAQADTGELRQRLAVIIGEEIARCPKMRAFTLPALMSVEELRYLAGTFHLDAITLDGEDVWNLTD